MKRINLLPTDSSTAKATRPLYRVSQPVKTSPKTRRRLMVGIAVLGLIGWQLFAVYQQRTRTANLKHEQEQLRLLKAQLQMEEASLEQERSAMTAQQQIFESRRKVLAGAKQPETAVSFVLTELGKLLPEDMWITQLSFTGKTIKIVGVSRETRSVATLMERLDRSRWFRDTAFSYTQRSGSQSSQEGQKTFTFEISTTPVLQAEAKAPS